jgi:hypothetical protein
MLDASDETVWFATEGALFFAFDVSWQDWLLALNGVAAIAIAPVINVVAARTNIGLRSERRLVLEGGLVFGGNSGDNSD